MRRHTIRLSVAAVSALECRGLEEAIDAHDQAVKAAWKGSRLVFYGSERDALFEALNEMSNAEDAFAEERNHDPELRRFAGRAARSLAAVAGRVLRA